MSESSQSPAPRKPVLGLQIKLPCSSRDEFRTRYGDDLSRGTFFVRTSAPRPQGTVIRFDLRLANGASVLRGVGVVNSVVTPGGSPDRPGMSLRLRGLDRASLEVLKELGIKTSLPVIHPAPAPAVDPPPPEPEKTLLTGPSTVLASAPEESAEQPVTEQKKVVELPEQTVPDPPLNIARSVAEQEPKPEEAEPEAAPQASVAPRHSGPVIGIDLGTANSAAAWVKGAKPMIIPSREGYSTLPSMVAIDEKARLLIGHPAKGQLLKNPNNTVYGAKRLIGRAFHSELIPQLQLRLPYQIVEGPRGESAVSIGGRVFSLQEISSYILKEVRTVAEAYLGQTVSRAVITVPAYYSDVQRQAVREAGALAGLTVEQIVSEPTAAAVAFGHGRTLQQRVLVYDLGGGTFDVSVLELRGNNIYEVVSTGGDTFLGGVDFDLRLLNLLIEKFEAKYGQELSDDPGLIQRFLDAAEKAKMALSEATSHRVQIPFVPLAGDRLVEFDTTVTRADFEQAAADLVERTLRVTAEVLAARQLKATDVEEILLVGGQSRMPLVREKLRAYFGKDPNRGVHPDEAVALGAALLAHAIETEAPNRAVLVDVLPMSIGIGTQGGRFKRVVSRNTALPHTHSYAASPGELEILVFQGESDRALDNQFLGSLRLDEALPAERNGRTDLTFRLSREAVLTITARDPESGEERVLPLVVRDITQRLREKLAEPSQPAPPKAGVFGLFRRWFGRQSA